MGVYWVFYSMTSPDVSASFSRQTGLQRLIFKVDSSMYTVQNCFRFLQVTPEIHRLLHDRPFLDMPGSIYNHGDPGMLVCQDPHGYIYMYVRTGSGNVPSPVIREKRWQTLKWSI